MNRATAQTIGVILCAGLLAGVLTGCQDPPPSIQGLVQDGNRLFYSGYYLEALGPYMKADERGAGDAEVKFKIGQCYFYLHSYREAIKWYQDALKNYPGHRGAAAQKAEAERRLPKPPPPTPQSGPEPVNVPSPRVTAEGYINNARTWEQQNDLLRAEEFYGRAVEAADDLAFTHAAMGRFYMRTGRNDKAEEQLKIALRLNPSEPNVADDLARLGGR